MKPTGRVSLVGAGPGDPELITLRGLKALQEADVVLYDRLVSPGTLDFARKDADLVYVGKRCGRHSKPQEEINDLLVEYASSGKRVVRLKNGDPFVFGRGGEELQALIAAGIPYEVIPGVTAALGAGAYAELPLTVRGASSCVTLVTGHEDPTKDRSDVCWEALARSGGTIVIYMAMVYLQKVTSKLIASGLPPDTPAAVVSRATTPEQVCIAAPLKELPDRVRERGLSPPSVVIIGRVVKLGRPAGWFEALPLLGRSVVVAAARGEDGLVRSLRDLGAKVYGIPDPDAADASTARALDAVRRREVSLVAFTSRAAIGALVDRLGPPELGALRRVPVAALGPQAAQAARERGLTVVVVSRNRTMGALVRAIRDYCLEKKIERPVAEKDASKGSEGGRS